MSYFIQVWATAVSVLAIATGNTFDLPKLISTAPLILTQESQPQTEEEPANSPASPTSEPEAAETPTAEETPETPEIPATPETPDAPTTEEMPESEPMETPTPLPEEMPESDPMEAPTTPTTPEAEPSEATSEPSELILDAEGELVEGDQVLASDNSLYDTYTFEGDEGQKIEITLESTEFDTYLAVLRPNNELLEEHDDVSQNDSNSSVTVTLPETGTYRVIVNSYDDQGRGTYKLKIRKFLATPPASPEP